MPDILYFNKTFLNCHIFFIFMIQSLWKYFKWRIQHFSMHGTMQCSNMSQKTAKEKNSFVHIFSRCKSWSVKKLRRFWQYEICYCHANFLSRHAYSSWKSKVRGYNVIKEMLANRNLSRNGIRSHFIRSCMYLQNNIRIPWSSLLCIVKKVGSILASTISSSLLRSNGHCVKWSSLREIMSLL